MVAQRSRNERVVGVAVRRVGGQQDLFLEPKVRAAVLVPVAEERRARILAVSAVARLSVLATYSAR